MPDLGKAYVQIVPSAKGISGSITNLLRGEADEAGNKGGAVYASKFASALKSGGAGIISTGAGIFAGLAGGLISGATVAAAGFIKSISSSAYQAYSSYEQLAGGTELLFGSAYNAIINKSKDAYKNVQMSQNDYLKQVNGFAVGLKTALNGDEKAAATLADKIITAEADIVAATGNSQEAVQNAFNGIMKSNYSMLDNLQLGINPTKAGMQEVIDKVNEWNKTNGIATAYTIDNLADVQSALVDYVKMQGMAGYSAAEGAKTIEGSSASVKAAWENVVTAIGRGEGISDAFAGLVESLFGENGEGGFISLVAARMPIIMDGIGQLINEGAPYVQQYIPPLIEQMIPPVITTTGTVMIALAESLPQYFPMIADTFGQLVDITGATLSKEFPELSFVFDNLGAVLEGAFALMIGGKFLPPVLQLSSTLSGPLMSSLGAAAGGIGALVGPIGIVVGALAVFGGAFVTLYKNNDEFAAKVDASWVQIQASIIGVIDKITPAWEAFSNFMAPVFTAGLDLMINSFQNFSDILGGYLDVLTGIFTGDWTKIKEGTLSIVQGMTNQILDIFRFKLDALEGLFHNLHLEFPHIKLPHFSISGDFGFNPPRVPSVSVEWYKKAMDQAYMLNSATIFGTAGNKLLGGGEAGSEMIIGTQKLMNMISQAAGNRSGEIVFNNTFNITTNSGDPRKLAEEISYYLESEYKQTEGAWA